MNCQINDFVYDHILDIYLWHLLTVMFDICVKPCCDGMLLNCTKGLPSGHIMLSTQETRFLQN